MRFLASSLADSVLADAILFLPRPLIPPTDQGNKGSSKNIRQLKFSNRKTIY